MSSQLRWAMSAALSAAVFLPDRVNAFEIDTSLTSGCHERITLGALASAGWPDGEDPPPPDDIMRRVIEDLTFDLPEEQENAWTVALLVGVRSNDVGSSDPFDVPALAELHNDPARQPEHCLRKREHDGEEGDVQALAACRAFILAELELALGPADQLDLNATTSIETFLAIRGEIDIDVPRFAYHLGRALHALEDSFTHSFRNASDQRVRHVLNWVEGNLGSGDDPLRDGHPHVSRLDECGDDDEGLARVAAATEAAADLMAAVANGAGGRPGRLQRAGAAFDEHTAREPGCTAANEWCGTGAMPAYESGCSAAGRAGSTAWLALLIAAIAGLARLPSARRRRALGRAALLTVALAGVGTAAADDHPRTLGAAASVGGAIDRAAAAASVGVRWNPTSAIGLGLDAEYNPWISLSGGRVTAGAASAYVPLIVRLKRFGTWELRTTAYAGASMLLFDLVGADKGTVGLFAGINPLGLALPIGSDAMLVIKPGDVAVSAPALQGIPFFYHQYRLTIGVEWYP
jgi:hypothetical protein